MINVISLVLSLLGGVLNALVKSDAPGEIIALVQGAITNLQQVHSTPVTFGQLESLRAVVEWGPGAAPPVVEAPPIPPPVAG